MLLSLLEASLINLAVYATAIVVACCVAYAWIIERESRSPDGRRQCWCLDPEGRTQGGRPSRRSGGGFSLGWRAERTQAQVWAILGSPWNPYIWSAAFYAVACLFGWLFGRSYVQGPGCGLFLDACAAAYEQTGCSFRRHAHVVRVCGRGSTEWHCHNQCDGGPAVVVRDGDSGRQFSFNDASEVTLADETVCPSVLAESAGCFVPASQFKRVRAVIDGADARQRA